jgi:hypothetical protein
MAIKGKSKRRSSKAVARGPKPAYVPVKRPLLRRRGVWIGVASVLGVAAIAGIVYGFAKQASDDRERDELERMAAALTEYQGQVNSILDTIGQPLPPASFDAFPTFAAALGGVEADDVPDSALEDARTVADEVATSAEDAAALFDQIPATDLVRGKDLPRDVILYVIGSHEDFARAMDLYRNSALLLSMAADAEADGRADLVASASAIHDLAEETFASAYADYVEAQTRAQIFAPSGTGPTIPITTGPTGSTG